MPDRQVPFSYTTEAAYLDTAAEGLPPLAALQATSGYLKSKSRGSSGRPDFYGIEARATQAAVQLLAAAPGSVALLSSASEGLNLFANSLDWRDGDEDIITDLEFPSNVYPWLRLRDRGVKLIVIPSRDGVLHLSDFTSRFSSRTRVVSASFVSYVNGTRLPFLSELGEAAHRAGALLCVDATQGLGRVPLSVENIDFLVSSSYKWLLGLHGSGVAYLGPQLADSFQPFTVGWYGARSIFTPQRFESIDLKPGAARMLSGMPNYAAQAALEQGICYLLTRGVASLYDDLVPLVRELRKAVERAGYPLLTPADEAFASGIVSFASGNPVGVKQALEHAGVIVWAGDGRVRASVHVYNDEGDIRRLADALPRLSR